MSVINKKLRAEMALDPEYSRCSLQGLLGEYVGPCDGRVTWEHAIRYASKNVQERWAIIPCCAAHHGVDQFQDAPTQARKEIRVWVALNRASDDELRSVNKAIDYFHERKRLNRVYGFYVPPPIPKYEN